MTERESIIERLKAVDLGGGSHESLSAIAKAVYEPAGGWTIVACEALRQTLVRLLGGDAEQGGCVTNELPGLLRKASKGNYEGSMGDVVDNIAQLIGCKSHMAHIVIAELADKVEQALSAAYTKGREDGINASYVPADEWIANHPYSLAERGWHQAVDADDKPIHIGSLVKYNGSVGKVTQIAYTIAAVIVTTDKWVTWKLNEVHVVDTLTVEDVLEELLREYDRDDSELTNGEIIGRFATKLRLVGDAE